MQIWSHYMKLTDLLNWLKITIILDQRQKMNDKKNTSKHTQASPASKITPIVQNPEKTTIQAPLFGAGINSKNQAKRTGTPPRPRPTTQRATTNVTQLGANALSKPANEVTSDVTKKPLLNESKQNKQQQKKMKSHFRDNLRD